MRRLKEELTIFGLASPRRIDALVARLMHLGYLESRPAEHDGRMRILTPTVKMMSLDREWLAYHYVRLQVMFPDSYAEPMARDAAFQRAQRLVALDFSTKGAEIMANNPSVMRFMGRDSGMLVLIKLVQMSAAADEAEGLSYTDIGTRFGVSRTHVRTLLEEAAQHGGQPLRPRRTPGRASACHAASIRPLRRGCDVRARFALPAGARTDVEGMTASAQISSAQISRVTFS